MRTLRYISLLCVSLLLSSCSSKPAPPVGPLTVAAAANLQDVFGEVGAAFKTKSGVEVVFSFGSTAQLSQQITNGAPFDVFAAADTEHIDSLVKSQKLAADSRAVYASGELALWMPKGDASGVHELKDLTNKQIRFISIAQPELAPYGQASVDALKKSNLWDALQPKVVYAPNISQAKQLATSGNADAAFTAYSLVLKESGTVLKVDPKLHARIDQALGTLTSSQHADAAKQFRTFLLGPDGRAILAKSGYLLP